MSNRRNERAKKEMILLRAQRGNKCEVCERPDTPDDPHWFAHIAETDIQGMGRGRKERITDIRQHPENYAYLCRKCHREFDYILGPVPRSETR